MAMSSPALAALIRDKLEAVGFNTVGIGKDGTPWLVNWSEAIAEAIVEHITASANATGTDTGGDSHTLNIV
jgi:hypothetical protein